MKSAARVTVVALEGKCLKQSHSEACSLLLVGAVRMWLRSWRFGRLARFVQSQASKADSPTHLAQPARPWHKLLLGLHLLLLLLAPLLPTRIAVCCHDDRPPTMHWSLA